LKDEGRTVPKDEREKEGREKKGFLPHFASRSDLGHSRSFRRRGRGSKGGVFNGEGEGGALPALGRRPNFVGPDQRGTGGMIIMAPGRGWEVATREGKKGEFRPSLSGMR